MAVDLNQTVGLNLETATVDKLPVAVSYVLRDALREKFPTVAENMRVQQHMSYMADHVAYTFHSFLTNIHKQDKAEVTIYSYPATVWDYFKCQFAPQWFLKRFPVRYDTKKIATVAEKNFMCPHMNLSDNYPHVLWMMNGKLP